MTIVGICHRQELLVKGVSANRNSRSSQVAFRIVLQSIQLQNPPPKLASFFISDIAVDQGSSTPSPRCHYQAHQAGNLAAGEWWHCSAVVKSPGPARCIWYPIPAYRARWGQCQAARTQARHADGPRATYLTHTATRLNATAIIYVHCIHPHYYSMHDQCELI